MRDEPGFGTHELEYPEVMVIVWGNLNPQPGKMEMALQRFASSKLAITTSLALALAGCAASPMGPTVQVMPGPGKSFDAFANDQATCKVFAQGQVQGQAEASNSRAAGTALLGAALGAGAGALIGSTIPGGGYYARGRYVGGGNQAGAGAAVGAGAGLATGAAIAADNQANDQMNIQMQYDNAFSQCMYSKGNQVPGYAPVAGPTSIPAYAASSPLVRSIQIELTRLGYLSGGADGQLGPMTRSAISRFESSQGMPVDGQPSSALLARLQGTPGGAPAAAAAPAQPGAGGSGTTASAPSNWVAPTTH
jgi:Putative peptidoglycan binding domain